MYEWLHPDLRDLPEIDWTQTPSRVISYLVNTVRNAPYAPHIALAIGVALGSLSVITLKNVAGSLNALLCTIGRVCETWDGVHLTKEVWEEYIAKTQQTSGRRRYLVTYSSVTERHLPEYVERLDLSVRARIAPYLLPRFPAKFLERYGRANEVYAATHRRRKEKSDILVPLHSILVALIQFRKQAAWRFLQAFRRACRQVESGEAELPLSFTYEDLLTEVNRHARTVAEIEVEQRPIQLQLTLWNRRTWVQHHPDDFSSDLGRKARQAKGPYSSETDQFFLQYAGSSRDLFWFGELLAHGMLHKVRSLHYRPFSKGDEGSVHPFTFARAIGVAEGFHTERPGLLSPVGGMGRWLSLVASRSDVVLIEPESLYRGILFGAALATIALTNGSRCSELLQVSADRFKAHQYEEKGNGQHRGRQRLLWLQHVLPKGKKTEAERQLFPISPGSYELLREIAAVLREVHGSIPVVSPHPDNTKAENLKAERYLFQWAASADGHYGAISPADVGTLIRFILYGLELHTKQGEPFVISTHLLRHVMATAARHEYDVPAEAVAYTLHHHQSGHSLPIATQYYSQQTEDQQLMILAEFMGNLEEQAASVLLTMPGERQLAEMDEDLRDVFERWHVLLETTFGFCGRVGLCPRGYNRSLCIGCPYLT
ncbi:MAG TPA: hypothetical protein VFV38_31595 [Ktedonobacteraceae bacterium]|nr:hypothetical protein [Ktedonobacteraceae bacterium]